MKMTIAAMSAAIVLVAAPASAAVRFVGNFPTSSFDFTVDSFIANSGRLLVYNSQSENPYTDGFKTNIVPHSMWTISQISFIASSDGSARMQLASLEPGKISRVWNYSLPTGALSRAGVNIATGRNLTDTGTLTLTDLSAPIAGALPEPATWSMLLIGFASIGAMLRYGRRSVHVRFG